MRDNQGIKMKASPSPSYISLVPFSSCLVFLLTTVIGNFGVSDADVVLRQDEQVLHRESSNRAGGNGNPTSLLSSSSNVPINPQHFQQQSLLELGSKRERGEELPHSETTSEAELQEQLYFRLLPPSPLQSSSRSEGGEKNSDDLALLEAGAEGIDLGYPLPLAMDDYWALGRDRLLDQLVIRALANPEEWTELRKAFEKVDGDLKALLSLEKGKNQVTPDGTTNSSLGYGVSYATTRSGSGSPPDSASSSPSSTQNQQQHHHGLKWKFAYHRVRDLNAAGQPRSRGIAAVVSLDTAENESKNETGSSSTPPDSRNDSTLKTSKASPSPFSKDGGVDEEEVKVGADTTSTRFDDPIEMLIGRGGGTPSTSTSSGSSSSSSSSTNDNNNIISNSFSRFGNKGKHVDLASDKSSGGSASSSNSDNSRKSSSVSNSEPKSALVLPTEIESQGNEPNSHKIQWDPRHGQGGGGDEVLGEKEVRHYGQNGVDDENDDHHPARHHHHRDHHYHKNYHHHQSKHHFQRQLSSSSSSGSGGGSSGDSGDGEPSESREKLPTTVVDEPVRNHYQNRVRSQYHHTHHNHHHDQHNLEQQHKEQNHHHFLKSNHQGHHHHREHGSPSWKRFHSDHLGKEE